MAKKTASNGSSQGRSGMTQRAYAEHIGLSRAGVRKAIASGRAVLHADGSIDVAASDALRAKGTDPAQQRGQHTPGQPARSAVAPASYIEARAENEALKTEERQLRLQKLRGELIDRQHAVDTVFGFAREHRDAWIGWPPRVAALIAAEVGVSAHQMQTVLARFVREHLETMADASVEIH